jgi:23S rRNA pseudouridine2605 synthase
MLQRVQKIISNAGFCSRRNAEQLIIEGKVKVNGKTITIGTSADPDKDKIAVEGKIISQKQKIYLAFNKPPDCITTLSDPQGRKTIFSYIREKERLIPVGRLDFKTEGLLLLTNDGDFANRIMHPSYETEKTYMVWLEKPFTPEAIIKVKEGVQLEETKTRPAKFRFSDKEKNIIEITLHEGMNRVVRRMMEALGYNVKRLMRTKVGHVELGDLRPGQTRKLSHGEVMRFVK